MCGRYQAMDEDTIIEMRKIIDEVNRRHAGSEQQQAMVTGEVYPTNIAPIIAGDGPRPMRWGYPPVAGSSRPVINARQETARTSPYFRNGLAERRIVIPTSGFYEWLHEGKKATDKFLFKLSGEPILYLAAIYSPFKQPSGEVEDRFTILTTNANHEMSKYHDRMPVYLSASELNAWINDPKCVEDILRRVQPELVARKIDKKKPSSSEQLSLFD